MILCSILVGAGSIRKQLQKISPSTIRFCLYLSHGSFQRLRRIRFESVLRKLLPADSRFFLQQIQRHDQVEELVADFWHQRQFGCVLPQPNRNFDGRNNRMKGTRIAGDHNLIRRLAISIRPTSVRRIGPMRGTQVLDVVPVPIRHLRFQVAHSLTNDCKLADEIHAMRASDCNFPQAILLLLCRSVGDFPLFLCRLTGIFPLFLVRLSLLSSAVRVSWDQYCDHDCHDAAHRLHPRWPLDVLRPCSNAWVTDQSPSKNSAGAESHHRDNCPVPIGPSLFHVFPPLLAGILPLGVIA